MNIRIVIPTLDKPFLLTQTLMSLRAEMKDGDSIVLVDNGSEPETLGAIRADIDNPKAKTRMIVNSDRGNYCKSVNIGVSHPGNYDALLVVNNDVVFSPGSLSRLRESLSDQCGLVIPLSSRCVGSLGVSPPALGDPSRVEDIYANYEKVCKWWRIASVQFSGILPVSDPYVPQGGYCFLIDRRLWDRLGGFDQDYRIFGEDYDLFARAARYTKLFQVRDAYVHHLEHQTVKEMPRRFEEWCRGRFLLTEKREGKPETVSVVIPTYNRSDLLFEAIDSVVRQSFQDWRLYVVDDGSGDWEAIRQAATNRFFDYQDRIWYFNLADNRGPAAARNYGVSLSRGKYVAFLDSDDTWNPDHLAKHVAFHESRPGLLMSYSRTSFAWRWKDPETGRFRYRPDEHPEAQLRGDLTFDRDRLERENFIKTSAVVVWGDVARSTEFPVEDDHRLAAEDWKYFRILAGLNGTVEHLYSTTARTYWSKRSDGDAHHSSRLIPWANFGDVPEHWGGRILASPGKDGALTVVIPTRERPLEARTLMSNLPDDVPVVLVADGRKSAGYVLELSQAREGVGAVVIEKPSGASFARNRGVDQSLTEWVWFIDDDDIPLPGAVEAVSKYFGQADAVVCPLFTHAGDGGLCFTDGAFTSGVFVRVDFFTRVHGFDEGLHIAEERELLQRMKDFGARVVECPTPVAVKTSGSRHVGHFEAPKTPGRPFHGGSR